MNFTTRRPGTALTPDASQGLGSVEGEFRPEAGSIRDLAAIRRLDRCHGPVAPLYGVKHLFRLSKRPQDEVTSFRRAFPAKLSGRARRPGGQPSEETPSTSYEFELTVPEEAFWFAQISGNREGLCRDDLVELEHPQLLIDLVWETSPLIASDAPDR